MSDVMEKKTPAMKLAQALYESLGKPVHMKHHGPHWKQTMFQILSDEEKYKFPNVLGAIRWMPSNKYWSSRITDAQSFRENIDKILSEYHASGAAKPRRKRFWNDISGNNQREAVQALLDTEMCPVCQNERHVPGEHFAFCDPATCNLRHRPPCPRCTTGGERFTELWRQLDAEEV